MLSASRAVIVGTAGGSVVQNVVASYDKLPKYAANGTAHFVGTLLSRAPAALVLMNIYRLTPAFAADAPPPGQIEVMS
jgi:hypothetical protein